MTVALFLDNNGHYGERNIISKQRRQSSEPAKLPDVFDKELADEVLCQLRCVPEVLGVEAVVNVGDVGECFLFGVAQKWRSTT